MYRIKELLRLKSKIFRTRDLAVLWHISNENTLYTTISRLLRQGILYPLQKGLYSVIPVEELNPAEIGLKTLGFKHGKCSCGTWRY